MNDLTQTIEPDRRVAVTELRRLLDVYRAASGLAAIVDAWYAVARAAHAALPALLDADAERDRLARLLDEPRRSGCAVEIAGVRIAPCDERGQTADMRERDALRAELDRMREREARGAARDHTAAIAEAARAWAKADREVADAIGQGGANRWRKWADLTARERDARAALRAVVDAETHG